MQHIFIILFPSFISNLKKKYQKENTTKTVSHTLLKVGLAIFLGEEVGDIPLEELYMLLLRSDINLSTSS